MNNRRNAYLREMEARLRHLPQSDRAEEMAEVTQHLDTLIAASQAEGKTEEGAVEEAIARFGAAREVGSRLYQADKHKRFAPLVDVALFYIVFSVVVSMLIELLAQTFWHSVNAATYVLALRGTVPEAAAHNIINFTQPRVGSWLPMGWAVSWLIGVGAFAVLAARYGVRGAFEKARQSPSVTAALRWFLCVYVLGHLNPLHLNRLFHPVPNHSLEGMTLIGAILLGNVVSLLIAGFAAYFVGRTNRSRESVADAVGCAAFVGVITGLLQMVAQFVPTPWGGILPTPFMDNLTGYLISFSSVIVYGFARVAVVYFGVQFGEKSRRPLFAHKGV